MITYIQGDICETDCMVIAHGVNCQGTMGSGVARALFEKWPAVRSYYLDYFTEFNAGPEGENFLGNIDDIWVNIREGRKKKKIVINCFTQQYFGPGDRKYLSYDALIECMYKVKKCCAYYKVNEVAIPKIGCGLAGGDWDIVESILKVIFPADFNVKVYIK